MRNWSKQLCVLAALLYLPAQSGAPAALPAPFTPEQQFSFISELAGRWDVEGNNSLTIIFELTAGNSVMVEKWMRGDTMHSMTVYHLDGNTLIATHYCPQGNQPRLAAHSAVDGRTVLFTFQDATDLDATEAYQHDLGLAMQVDGTLKRTETYWGPDGAGEPSVMILTRAKE